MHLSSTALVALGLPSACPAPMQEPALTDAPRELGAVAWQRKLEPALDASRATGRPVLLLFQEVPG
ncbi:MAG: hypothetical protein R3F49_24810 [Planctomycetota bacterium]